MTKAIPVEPAAASRTASTDGFYAFEVSLHRHPGEAGEGSPHADAWGTWPTLAVPREAALGPLAVSGDEALERLAAEPRLFAEPDGSFVWTSSQDGPAWQVDGNLLERDGRVVLLDLKGSCPRAEFDRLLACVGWPAEPLMFQLVRAAVFLDEAAFRRHAAARGAAGDGQALRPD
jgi:hypothetical protein